MFIDRLFTSPIHKSFRSLGMDFDLAILSLLALASSAVLLKSRPQSNRVANPQWHPGSASVITRYDRALREVVERRLAQNAILSNIDEDGWA
jgi:hypothetical protein